MIRAVLAGGGSAGHTSPLIATAEQLLAGGGEVTCIGTARGLETRVIPAAGLPLELIDPVPIPRKPSVDLARVPVRLARSIAQARRIIKAADAQVVVGFGGYVSAPAYLAARQLGVPVVIHEQNALPGLANKLAARFAKVVAVSFPDTPLPGARFIGLPVRTAVRELAHAGRASRRAAARVGFELDPDRRTLLVSGGSQGAHSINTALLGARDEILARGVQVLHVWGPKNLPADAAVVTDPTTGASYHPVAYVDQMTDAYAAADLMLGRSGAGTVVETAVVGLPAIFVPLPHGNGEQARNASSVIAAGGAVLVPDADLTPQRLLTELAVLNDADTLAGMSAAEQQLMSPDAALVLADLVRQAAGQARPADGQEAGHGTA